MIFPSPGIGRGPHPPAGGPCQSSLEVLSRGAAKDSAVYGIFGDEESSDEEAGDKAANAAMHQTLDTAFVSAGVVQGTDADEIKARSGARDKTELREVLRGEEAVSAHRVW